VATTLLYDSDCGFCRATLGLLLAWDRGQRLRPVALQSEEASRLLPELSPAQRLEAVRAVPESGIPHAAGAAAALVLRELPGGKPLAALAARLPGATEQGYALVAGNRSKLSPLVPAGLLRRADGLIARRAAGR
jgi:predicted DCC family thiol-disulfide oxidoreductase YuxK